jgi:hypothetical protein
MLELEAIRKIMVGCILGIISDIEQLPVETRQVEASKNAPN